MSEWPKWALDLIAFVGGLAMFGILFALLWCGSDGLGDGLRKMSERGRTYNPDCDPKPGDPDYKE